MNRYDTYYKALREFRKITDKSEKCVSNRQKLINEPSEIEKITVSHNICQIDEDWITAIEEGLIYIDKAIREERQFIYSNGEVVPIELVKNVSRESVIHLAKHSNLISTANNNEIIPEKLYSVERLNDYAVYENRFLYMLLCYLRDFVSTRLQKLTALISRYEGNITVNKQVESAEQSLKFSVCLSEVCQYDEFLKQNSKYIALIDRIEIILKTIIALLSTPLMDYASKAPLLSPPITKTNILKMDNNFKGAVALYDFIISYDKDGYSFENKVTEISSFENELSENIAEIITLLSFLTRQDGLKLKEVFKINYEREDFKSKQQELDKKADQIELLKKRMDKSGISNEEYVARLEEYVNELRLELLKSDALSVENEQIKKYELILNQRIEDQNTAIKTLTGELQTYKEKLISDIRVLNSEHEKNITEINRTHENEINEIKNLNSIATDEIRSTFENKLAESSSLYEDLNARIAELIDAQEKLTEEKRVIEARLKALYSLNGQENELGEFTDKDKFDELEKEYEAFKKFYDKQWNMTKKKIRKTSLNWKNIKK